MKRIRREEEEEGEYDKEEEKGGEREREEERERESLYKTNNTHNKDGKRERKGGRAHDRKR